MDLLKRLVKKLIPKNIAGIIGVIQVAVPLVRELIMLLTRVCDSLIPGKRDDEIIAKIKVVFDNIEVIFIKVKDFLLKLGE